MVLAQQLFWVMFAQQYVNQNNTYTLLFVQHVSRFYQLLLSEGIQKGKLLYLHSSQKHHLFSYFSHYFSPKSVIFTHRNEKDNFSQLSNSCHTFSPDFTCMFNLANYSHLTAHLHKESFFINILDGN